MHVCVYVCGGGGFVWGGCVCVCKCKLNCTGPHVTHRLKDIHGCPSLDSISSLFVLSLYSGAF